MRWLILLVYSLPLCAQIDYCGTNTGPSNTFACANKTSIGAYRVGEYYSFLTKHANTGSATLAIDRLMAFTIRKQAGTVDLAAGDIPANALVTVQFDGSAFQLVSSIANAKISVSTSTIQTGPSGALDCVSTPGVCDIATAIVPLKPAANYWLGANDFGGAPFLRLANGVGVPSANCALPADVGKVQVRSDAKVPNSSLYLCSQTGDGVYGWELAQGNNGTASSTGGIGGITGIQVYNASGALQIGQHIVTGHGNFNSYSGTISFSGAAAFSSVSSYACSVSDTAGGGTPVGITLVSGAVVSLTDVAGQGNGPYEYICVGN